MKKELVLILTALAFFVFISFASAATCTSIGYSCTTSSNCTSLNGSVVQNYSDTCSGLNICCNLVSQVKVNCTSQGYSCTTNSECTQNNGTVMSNYSDTCSGLDVCCNLPKATAPSTTNTCASSGYTCTTSSNCSESGGVSISNYSSTCSGLNVCCNLQNNATLPTNANDTNSSVFSVNCTSSGYACVSSSECDQGNVVKNLSNTCAALQVCCAPSENEDSQHNQSAENITCTSAGYYCTSALNCSQAGGNMLTSYSDSCSGINICCSQLLVNTSNSTTTPPQKVNGVLTCSSGCLYKGDCIPLGYRVPGKYCNIGGNLTDQLGSGSCDNNFQCSSNLCVNSECVTQSFIQKLINFFKNLLGLG